jgi:uncharacterized Fe-S radical SAM superfamily protein PflX
MRHFSDAYLAQLPYNNVSHGKHLGKVSQLNSCVKNRCIEIVKRDISRVFQLSNLLCRPKAAARWHAENSVANDS